MSNTGEPGQAAAPQYRSEDYARHRPQYPQQLFDNVLEYCGAGPRELALDLGTGKQNFPVI